MKKILKTVIIISLFIGLVGCKKDEVNDQSIAACVKAGGIPILSSWDRTTLARCIFPPTESL